MEKLLKNFKKRQKKTKKNGEYLLCETIVKTSACAKMLSLLKKKNVIFKNKIK